MLVLYAKIQSVTAEKSVNSGQKCLKYKRKKKLNTLMENCGLFILDYRTWLGPYFYI